MTDATPSRKNIVYNKARRNRDIGLVPRNREQQQEQRFRNHGVDKMKQQQQQQRQLIDQTNWSTLATALTNLKSREEEEKRAQAKKKERLQNIIALLKEHPEVWKDLDDDTRKLIQQYNSELCS